MVMQARERWQDALTTRVRALIRLEPLSRVEADKGRRALALERVDLRGLCLRVLDVTIEEMGLTQGCPRELVMEALRAMVCTMLGDADAQAADEIAQLVLAAMLNDAERRRAFSARYVDWTDAGAVARELSWHLLREVELPDGSYVLQASTEGINVYTGMLEFDVQDAQVAEEAVLQAQIKRGRIEDAVRTANNARLRSIEYHQTLRRVLRLVARDVSQVRWVDDVLRTLGDARVHLSDRLSMERELLGLLSERAEGAAGDDARRIAELRDALEDCQSRHVHLHHEVLQANRTFLEEQERQLFRPRAVLRLPDMEAEVLCAALERPAEALGDVLEPLLSAMMPPLVTELAYLPQWVDRLLAPPRREAPAYDLEPAPLSELESERLFYSEQDDALVTALLRELAAGPATLSLLLRALRARGGTRRAEQLLALRALHGFEPAAVVAHVCEPAGALQDAHFAGQDLRLSQRRGAAAIERSEALDRYDPAGALQDARFGSHERMERAVAEPSRDALDHGEPAGALQDARITGQEPWQRMGAGRG